MKDDALGDVLCQLDLPQGTKGSDLSLAVSLDAAPPDAAALFESLDPVAGSAWAPPAGELNQPVAASGAVGNSVVGYVSRSGRFGVTTKSRPWAIDRYVGSEVVASNDVATLLRNLSGNLSTSAFFDGTNFFLGNGPRVLIYKGIPTSPNTRPVTVLGQPGLDATVAATSSALFGTGAVYGLWSDGARLATINGQRVLIWQQTPSTDLTPADIVLGQPDFVTNRINAGGVSAHSFSSPVVFTSDGTKVVVADALNHRLLGWSSFPTTSGQAADFVIGQPDFTSSAPNSGSLPLYLPEGAALTANGVYVSGVNNPALLVAPTAMNPPRSSYVFGWQYAGDLPAGQLASPAGVTVLPNGAVAVRDFGSMRIALTRSAPTGPAPIDFVLGQPDVTRVSGMRFADGTNVNPARVNASTLSLGLHTVFSGGVFLAADTRRTLVWDTLPSYNYEPASRVIGQPGFTVNERADYRGISLSTLASPSDVATAAGTVGVADKSNNRVLLFKTADLANPGAAAFAALGQASGTDFTANKDLASPSATTLSGPEALALDGTHLIVADTENHRVLIWNSVPSTSGRAADVVLGQADFTHIRPNHGRGDVSPVDGISDPDADGFFYPSGVASDGTHLFVADRLNHRVLVWDSFPTTNGQPATRVLGQPTMKTAGAHGGLGAFTVTANGFNLPTGLSLDGTTLWVCDSENNRVVRWENATSGGVPTAWVGQADGVSVLNANYVFSAGGHQGDDASPAPSTTAASVLRPRGVVAAAGKLFVSEVDSNRVHVFDATSLTSLSVLGQSTNTLASPNSGGVSPASLAEPMGLASDGTSLFVADARNHRLLGYALAQTGNGASATVVAGQATMVTNGFNQSSVAAAGATSQPRALALIGDTAFVADSGNNRVIQSDVAGVGWTPKRVFGQPNDTLALANSGGAISAHGLSGPGGVAADAVHLLVADTNNNRVLVFDRAASGGDALFALGQADFTSGASNRGGAPTSATLARPSGVCTNGTRVAVTDGANHRVLVWKAFPTASGQAADVILGQADGSANQSNRGLSDASAQSLSFPSACLFSGDDVLVADSGNNRVLRFAASATTGAGAIGVIGQPDLKTRTPASVVADTIHLAGPSALSTDGASLYIADRDLGRVVVIGADGKVADVLGGVGSASVLRAGAGIAARRSSTFTTRLYVSDTAADKIALVVSLSRLVAH